MPPLQLVPAGQMRSWITLIWSEFFFGTAPSGDATKKVKRGGGPRGQLPCLVQSVLE